MASSIPFVKPARVGNFKLWRSRYTTMPKSGGVDVECVNVSNAEGTWCVRVPSTFEMFAVLNALYDDYSGEDKQSSERASTALSAILSNMAYSTTIGNGFYHRALGMVATCYACPDILDEKSDKYKELKENVAVLVSDFLEWVRQLMEFKEGMASNDDDRREEVADQAREILEEVEDAG